jgi:serine/threonine-protein kinase
MTPEMPEPLRGEPARPAGATPEALPEIPGYAVHAVIGRGATGVVYRATQLAVDRSVAIKVLHPELSARKKAVARLQREARTTARLAHPGIVSAIDMGHTAGGLWWYAMELVEGPSLADMLKEKQKLGERAALRLFIPLCEALQHAFEAGVVHRDVKPANILIDATGRARLVDLGLAFTETDPLLTGSGAGTLGTPHYVSPEQARNPESADVRSDIWSLGATLYHAVCGRPPFAGESVAEILSGVLYARVQDPCEVEPSVSKGLALVLRKCLARMPERRYQEPRELLADLERLRERLPVAVEKKALDPLRREHDPLARWLSFGGVALAVAVAVGLVAWRPWSHTTSTGIDPGAQRTYEPLEKVARAVERGTNPARWASGLAQLESLRPELPPEAKQRFDELQRDLAFGSRQAREAFVAGFKGEFLGALASGDLIGAAALLDSAEERIQVVLAPQTPAQAEGVRSELRLEGLASRYALAEQAAADDAVDLLRRHYREVVLPAVDERIAAGRWTEARAMLAGDPRQHFEALLPPRLPESVLSDVRKRIGDLVLDWREERDQRWRELDQALTAWVEARATTMGTRVRDRDAGAGAQALRVEFEAELARRGLVPDGLPSQVSDEARKLLELRYVELAGLEQELLRADAEVEFASLYRSALPLWSQREYAAIARLWRAAEQEAWLAPVHDKIRLERQEAELLAQLLERAAERVGAAETVLIGTIRHQGPNPGLDPLHRGFLIGNTRYFLRGPDASSRLPPEGVEDLAGIPQEPASIREPRDRLVRALFRDREGAPDVAAQTYDSGELPGGEHTALVVAFGQRIHRTKVELDKVQEQRLQTAMNEFYNIKRTTGEAHLRQPAERLRQINDLLTNYSDLEFVRANRDELLAIKARLESPERPTIEAALKANFAPTELEIKGRRTTLAFEFGVEAPRWVPGDWAAFAGEGWRATQAFEEPSLLDAGHWPRLELGPPLDLSAPGVCCWSRSPAGTWPSPARRTPGGRAGS